MTENATALAAGPCGVAPAGVTQVDYAAYQQPSTSDPAGVNPLLFAHRLSTVDRNAPGLCLLTLVEGTLWFGTQLGPFRTQAGRRTLGLPGGVSIATRRTCCRRRRRNGSGQGRLHVRTAWAVFPWAGA